jgi:cyclopropane-fatty-acyl-phospholipid synthase
MSMNTSTIERVQHATVAQVQPIHEAVPGAHLPKDAPASARVVFKLLQGLKRGMLDVQWPDGSLARFGRESVADGLPRATLRLHNWLVCSAAMKSGDIGFAESYIAGDWTTPDLAALLKVMVANRDEIESAVYGSWIGRLAYRIKHLLNHNSKANSRKNIHAHYDLGNAFYRLWLDETMNYSSALFDKGMSMPLAKAQHAKVRRALVEAGVIGGPAEQRVLEIGCGWGALAEKATLRAHKRACHGRDLVDRTTGLGPPAPEGCGSGRPRRPALAGLPRHQRREPFDAMRVHRDVRSGRPGLLAQLLRQRQAACSSGVVGPASRPSPSVMTCSIATASPPTSSSSTSSQGACCPAMRSSASTPAQAGLVVINAHAFGPDYAETLRRWRARLPCQRESASSRAGL